MSAEYSFTHEITCVEVFSFNFISILGNRFVKVAKSCGKNCVIDDEFAATLTTPLLYKENFFKHSSINLIDSNMLAECFSIS